MIIIIWRYERWEENPVARALWGRDVTARWCGQLLWDETTGGEEDST